MRKKLFTFLFASFFIAFLVQCLNSEFQSDPMALSNPDSQIQEMLFHVSEDTIEKNIRTLADFGTRHTLSDTSKSHFGIGAARRWIKSELHRYSERNNGRLIVEFDGYIQEPAGRIPDSVEIVNVVATLPGTDPDDDRIFVVSGHYDSRASDVMDAESLAPGANDDASGTAAVMEMARVMSAYDYPATIVFMAVAGEEQGLFGARHWAEQAAEENKNITGMITNDIIGNHASENGALADPNCVRLFAEGIPPHQEPDDETLRYLQTGGENDLPTRQFARTVREVAESYLPEMKVWLIYRRDRYLRGGDHIPFLEEGYPALRFSEPHEEYKHQHQDIREEDGIQYGDLPEFVDFDYVARVARVNLAAIANLARSPRPPENVGMNVSRLENDTRLRWNPSPSEFVGGYEVLWRETTSPVWQFKDYTEDTEYTAELLSKDNWVFGVRAVSENGHIGIPVYPMPFRD